MISIRVVGNSGNSGEGRQGGSGWSRRALLAMAIVVMTLPVFAAEPLPIASDPPGVPFRVRD